MQTGARVLPGGRSGAVGRIAAVQSRFLCEDNLQLCNRAFYAPPSPVIGCHRSCVRWGGRLHGSFPDFPGDFFSLPLSPQLHSHSIWRPNRHADQLFLKILPTRFFCASAAPPLDVKKRKRQQQKKKSAGASDWSALRAATAS